MTTAMLEVVAAEGTCQQSFGITDSRETEMENQKAALSQ